MQLSRRQWNLLIKTVVILAFTWVLFKRFDSPDELAMLWSTIGARWQVHPSWIFWCIVLMMPLNWLLESMKWRILMIPAVLLSWRRSIAGVFSGITFSLLMPNRIGEYGGRILYVDAKHTWQAVLASLAGSFAQNLVHVSIGFCAGLVLFISGWSIPETLRIGLVLIILCMILIMFVCYFSLPAVVRVLKKWRPPRLFRGLWDALEHLTRLTRKQLFLALILAFFRYLIFSSQYMLLLWYFGVDVPFTWLAGGVAVIYLAHTSIPLPPVVDLIARNEMALFIWGGFGINEQSVIAAGLMIWILNLAIPALCGLFAIATVNVHRSIRYERKTQLSTSPYSADRSPDRSAE